MIRVPPAVINALLVVGVLWVCPPHAVTQAAEALPVAPLSATTQALTSVEAFALPSLDVITAMFARGEASGEELMLGMRALRQAAAARQMTAVTQSLLGMARDTAHDPSQILANRAWWERMLGSGIDAAGDYFITRLSYAALDDFFGLLLDDRKTLARVKVPLPQSAQVNEARARQLVFMASAVAAVGAAVLIVEKAEEDFKQVESRYKDLMSRRLEAARLFADAMLLARAEAREREVLGNISPPLEKEDLQFLSTFPSDKLLKDFTRDFRAQNIALAYLRNRNPGAYQDYRTATESFLADYRGYFRALTGAGSAGAFSFLFFKEAKNLYVDLGPQATSLLSALSAAWASNTLQLYNKLTPTLLSRIWDRTGGFRIAADGRLELAETRAEKALAHLKRAGVLGELQSRMFGQGPDSFLYRVHLCDPFFAAGYFDQSVGKDSRSSFVTHYFGIETPPEDFNFKDAMTGRMFELQSEVLTSDLLVRRPQPQDNAVRERAVRDAQDAVMARVESWKTHELLRVLLANHRGPISDPHLTLGTYSLHIVPSKESLYEYEAHLQGCARHVSGSSGK